MDELKEKVGLQNERISKYKETVKNLEENKSNLREEIERQDIIIYKMKKRVPEECSYGCRKYNKSVDEIVIAGNKHKEKLLAIKDIAEEQKGKIISLRNQKSKLEKHLDKMTDDLEMERKYVHTIQLDSVQKINKLKNELKASEESRKVLKKEKDESMDESKAKINELEHSCRKNEQVQE